MADLDKQAQRLQEKRDDRLEEERMARAKGKRASDEMVYEVLVDTFGADDFYHKGDLFTQAEAPAHYDLDWALRLGSIREAPEYRGSGLRSTTQPVEGQPAVIPAPPAAAEAE